MSVQVFAGLMFAGTLAVSPLVSAHVSEGQEAHVHEVLSLAGLPAGLRANVVGMWGGQISDRGGPFNSGCILEAGIPNARFVSAVLASDNAVVTVEQGGRAHYHKKLEFTRAEGAWTLTRQSSEAIVSIQQR
jgi:hypothetical protein